jgi:hypothetical protein
MKFCRSQIHFCIMAFIVLIGLSGHVFAELTTLIEQGAKWSYVQYNFVPDGEELAWQTDWSSWNSAGYDSFDWNNATWSEGNAAFGSWAFVELGLVPNTNWDVDHGLALRKSYFLDGTINGNLTLNVASDNGFMLFVNGNQVAKDVNAGYTTYWEYSLDVPSSFFVKGVNIIEVLAEDHGGQSYFDMKLSGDIIPEPGTFLLMGTGIMCWLRKRRSL